MYKMIIASVLSLVLVIAMVEASPALEREFDSDRNEIADHVSMFSNVLYKYE